MSVGVSLSTHTTHARPFRVSQVPNGEVLGCRTCHFGNGGAVNSFGYDVSLRLAMGDADWPAVCMLDSDNDGFSNAEELGDPDCTWRVNSPSPDVETTHPGDAQSYPGRIVDMMVPLPDMEIVDMSPPPDLGPPVDMEVDIWDASVQMNPERDAFMTTDEPWIEPDLGEVDAALTADMMSAEGGEESESGGEVESGEEIESGEESESGEEAESGEETKEPEIAGDQFNPKREAQSGCDQYRDQYRGQRGGPLRALWLFLILGMLMLSRRLKLSAHG